MVKINLGWPNKNDVNKQKTAENGTKDKVGRETRLLWGNWGNPNKTV